MYPSLDEKICIAQLLGPSGVKGGMRVKFFTTAVQDALNLSVLYDENQQAFSIKEIRSLNKDFNFYVKLKGIDDRTSVERMNKKMLYIERASLPPPAENEFYYADLIGLEVHNSLQKNIGTVMAMHNFGAGDILEVRGDEGEYFIPFTQDAVPCVALDKKKILIDEAFLIPNSPVHKERKT